MTFFGFGRSGFGCGGFEFIRMLLDKSMLVPASLVPRCVFSTKCVTLPKTVETVSTRGDVFLPAGTLPMGAVLCTFSRDVASRCILRFQFDFSPNAPRDQIRCKEDVANGDWLRPVLHNHIMHPLRIRFHYFVYVINYNGSF